MNTKPEVSERNKVIAEFEQRKFYGRHTIDKFGGNTANALPEMKYHESWEWLMPVIIKISDYHYPDYWSNGKPEDAHDFADCAYPCTFGMRDADGNYMVRLHASTLFTAPTLIEATHAAVYDFIVYYNNEQNKTWLNTTRL